MKFQHGWNDSYLAVRRLVVGIPSQLPPATTFRLDFEPGGAARVDFGAGPTLVHPEGQPRRTWAFFMTLASRRHQNVEFVGDQMELTLPRCHRRALEWVSGVALRGIIDCAIKQAAPELRAFAECAGSYRFEIDLFRCMTHKSRESASLGRSNGRLSPAAPVWRSMAP